MGNSSSVEDGSGLASPNILSKVTVKGSKADMDAFLTEGRVNNVQIAYVTKKQVGERELFEFCLFAPIPRLPHQTKPALVVSQYFFRSSLSLCLQTTNKHAMSSVLWGASRRNSRAQQTALPGRVDVRIVLRHFGDTRLLRSVSCGQVSRS